MADSNDFHMYEETEIRERLFINSFLFHLVFQCCMGSVSVSSCRCMYVSRVHTMAVLNAA